jgi:site-specific DNA recombinase
MGETKKRALIVTRLSRVTEATTSPERQYEECEKRCVKRDYEIVGEAYDPDISAAVPPFDRPVLGKWLKTPERYDVLVFYRMDRLVRRLSDLADLVAWCDRNDVVLVSATEEFLDLDAPFGDIIALLVAKVAEMELEAIRARTGDASRHTIEAGRWRGGVPPWGYVPARADDGKHWKLVQDPEQVEVIHEVVERVLKDKEPLRSIAHDLTKRGILTPKDRFTQIRADKRNDEKKREIQGYEWHSSPLKRMLTSPAMLGRIVTREPLLGANEQPLRDDKGNRLMGPETVVLDEAGVPVERAAPILSEDVFNRLGAELASRENRKEPTKRSSGLLLGIISCGVCGAPGYRLKGGPGRKPRYRCGSAQNANQCDNRTIDLEWADEDVQESIVGRLGPMERMRRVWDSGSDSSAALAEVQEMLADLADLVGTAGYKKGTPQRERLDARIASLSARQEELEAAPVVPAGWKYEGTGQTVAQWWEAADNEARNIWLREMGVKARWRSHTEGGVRQTEGKLKGKVIGGRTVRDEWVVDIGELDLNAEILPGAIAGWSEFKHADADGQWSNIPDLFAEALWRDGDALAEMVAADEAERERGSE